MLRFGTQKRRPARNYSSRREQLRLLALFVPLALVIFVMGRLRDPKIADGINQIFAATEEKAAIKPRPVVADSAPPRSPEPHPGIRVELLKTIEDNTYFRTAEKEAWFHFIELMKDEKTGTTQGVPVEYAQLVDQSNVYRGKLVTVRGTARQITQEKPAENDLGISAYYRVVMQPADGANWPIVVYCLELPEGVSPGDEIAIDVTVTGLFFKKLSYNWRDGLGIAPVIVANKLATTTNNSDAAAEVELPAGESHRSSDNPSEKPGSVEFSENPQEAFQKILSLAGWDVDRLAKFEEGNSLTDAQRVEALELLYRLRLIRTGDLDAWSNNVGPADELKNLDDLRGQLRRVNGIVTKVTQHKLPSADAERLEMPAYFECEFKAANVAQPTTIIAGRVPSDWLGVDPIHEVAAANVLFVKRLTDETPPRTLWLAKEIAWHPPFPVSTSEKPREVLRGGSDPRLGKSLLGMLTVDVGKFDQVQGRGPIRAFERDLFYETMHAAGLIQTSTLVHTAKCNLPLVKQQLEQRLRDGGKSRREALAREVVRRADEGQYSVALLFNEPLPQRGRLFSFDGIARRAVRVEVGGLPDRDRASDVAKQYEINHYYELEVFTDDSQNYPLIFCVRELPKGFPIGADIRVPVRVAGFFFKNWLYSTRGRGQSDETADGKSTGPQAQFAPLLIGRGPIVLATEQGGSRVGRFVLGGLFVLAMAGIWAAAAWLARDDRRFRERTPAANFALPAGQSLNDLNVPAADLPMVIEVGSPPFGESSK